MESNEEKVVLKYDNVVVSPRGIAETHGKKIVIFIPTTEIDRLTLKFGRSDHNPVFSISIGVVLALVGIYGLVDFFIAMRGYRYELGMVALGIIGGSLIFDSLKERHFFEVETKKGTRRLVFSKNAGKSDIDDFCNKIRNGYKYQITEAV